MSQWCLAGVLGQFTNLLVQLLLFLLLQHTRLLQFLKQLDQFLCLTLTNRVSQDRTGIGNPPGNHASDHGEQHGHRQVASEPRGTNGRHRHPPRVVLARQLRCPGKMIVVGRTGCFAECHQQATGSEPAIQPRHQVTPRQAAPLRLPPADQHRDHRTQPTDPQQPANRQRISTIQRFRPRLARYQQLAGQDQTPGNHEVDRQPIGSPVQEFPPPNTQRQAINPTVKLAHSDILPLRVPVHARLTSI